MTEKQTCPVCGERFWNRGHHAEACTGPPVFVCVDTEQAWITDQFARDNDGA